MEKTLTLLIITIVVSVMSIPIAYLVGQRSAQDRLERRFEDERARIRSEQQTTLESLQRELSETRRAYERATEAAEAAKAVAQTPAPRQVEAENPTAAVDNPAPRTVAVIPHEKFASASLGMTYDEVVEQFGREGTVTFTLEEESGSITKQYVWEWTNGDGTPGHVHLSFENGKLDAKSYSD